MTVDELRSLLLALPGHLDVALRTSDPGQSIVILASLERVTLVAGAAPGLLLEAETGFNPGPPLPPRRLHALPSLAKEPAP